MKIITYIGSDEILVTVIDNEAELIREYFLEGGRELDDYDRRESDGVLEITQELKAW